MRFAPRLFPARMMNLAALWLLASIFAHALAPVGQPIERHSGSAFSVSTWDVSLGPSRESDRSVLERATAAPDTATGAGTGAALAAAAPGFDSSRYPTARPSRQAGPPAHAVRSAALPPPARGPPSA